MAVYQMCRGCGMECQSGIGGEMSRYVISATGAILVVISTWMQTTVACPVILHLVYALIIESV